ncbi:MAG: DUF3151 family protein [Actinomycetales bacterium]|nr:DUF3151 family protein [Actinomycetales bacterium]
MGSSLAWALLAEVALDAGAPVTAYACPHRLPPRLPDALRRAGWRGEGPIPVVARAQPRFSARPRCWPTRPAWSGEDEEAVRCASFLRSPPARPPRPWGSDRR